MAPSLGVFSSDESDKSLKEKITAAIRQLESQRKDLEQLKLRLEERRRCMFDATIKAIEKSDEMRARVLAGEHLELQKITRVVGASELAILHICVRLETIRDVGDVMFVLSAAFKTVKRVGKTVHEVVPNLESTATEINGSFANILSELGMISPNVNIALSDSPMEIFSKAQQLIDERTSELADLPNTVRGESSAPSESIFEETKRVALLSTEGDENEDDEDSEEFKPMLFSSSSTDSAAQMQDNYDTPIDPENVVRSYVKKLGASRLDVTDASAQLNLPVDLVEQAYIKVLAEKQFPSNPAPSSSFSKRNTKQ